MRNLSVAVAAAVSTLAAAPAVLAQPAPIEAYAALPAIQATAVSPDGANLAYIRRTGDSASVVAQARTGEVLVTIDVSDRTARSVFWASPDHVVIQSTVIEHLPGFAAPLTFAQLDIVNVRTRQVSRALRKADRAVITGSWGHVVGTYRGEPVLYVQTLTMETQSRIPSLDVYRVGLDDGRGRLHQVGAEDTRDYVVRRDGTIAARVTYDDETGVWRVLTPAGGNWREILSRRQLLDMPSLVGLGRSEDTVLLSELREDGPVLVEISLADGSEVAEHDNNGLAGILRDNRGLMIGLSHEGLTQDYTLFSPDIQAVWAKLQQGLPGRQLTLGDINDDLSVLVFHSEGAGDPGTTYVYDGARQSVSLVGRDYPDLKPADVGQVSVLRYSASDGRELFGYLTRPASGGDRNLPLIIMPHGGPESRDHAGFDWWAQAMASRGYLVFQPQFRGSDGFGQELLEAGYGEYGRKMQTDLSDAVDYLVKGGLADRNRVCIVGASYGGYAALAGMTLQQDIYRCAVAVAPVADLTRKLELDRRRGGRDRENTSLRYWMRFIGVDRDNDPLLAELSPSQHAAQAQGPILLIHGRADTVVPFEHSTIMERALRQAGKDVELIPLDGEDHYLSLPATRRQMLAETIEFLEAHNPPR
ncbi:alpha/beta hydrolase family protein [Brevundimonas sp. Root1279]|uniref:alpha/beta hydrolase family protein n=1 Tax=Brevundimonas sp. Root1279 TaxID=1736443 RepID=UPI00138ECC66|nr:S9 family peptidase [Brevundimonas sp. Root1279]